MTTLGFDGKVLTPVSDVHPKVTFHVTGPAWVVMRRQGYGRVVTVQLFRSIAAGPAVAG